MKFMIRTFIIRSFIMILFDFLGDGIANVVPLCAAADASARGKSTYLVGKYYLPR